MSLLLKDRPRESTPEHPHVASPPGIPRAEALLVVATAALGQPSFDPAAAAFCLRLAMTVSARRVALGLDHADELRLMALSHGAVADLDRSTTGAILAAMHESRDQARTLCAGGDVGDSAAIDAATRRLRRLGQGGVLVIPLARDHAVAGVVTIEFDAAPDLEARLAVLARLCEDMVVLAAPYLLSLRREQRGLLERARDALARGRLRGRWQGLRRWHVVTATVIAVLGWTSVVPATVTIGAPARLEGAIERVIAAPVAGFVKSFQVRPGDAVEAGQVVAELIDRDLQIERSRYQGEIVQHENAFAAAMAHSDRASMMIHQARLEEARSQAALIDQQLARIRMRAPISGIIIHGDLSQMIGAPVEKGQVLMTAAPREQRRVIVEVDERDIHLVQPGQAGRLSVSALPWDWVDLSVRRITPMAQVVEGRNVFEVEADVRADAGELRPGLRGVARIDVGRAPPLQVWARRLLDHLHRFAWRWMP